VQVYSLWLKSKPGADPERGVVDGEVTECGDRPADPPDELEQAIKRARTPENLHVF
jgi:hypothetical protein